ncbi:MAG: DUF2922 domain-containing protein [Chloroflexi bacterium]|nr:DUF2922 domain-containing protein [Chloroflexota bacterium]
MAKTLYMRFRNADGGLFTISLPNPKDTLADAEVDALMNQIITDNLFSTSGGDLVSKEDAYVQDVTVTQITLT